MDLELRESKTALPIHELWTLVYTTASKTTEQAMSFTIRDSALSSTRQQPRCSLQHKSLTQAERTDVCKQH